MAEMLISAFSKPSPSATRPPHRGEKAKYKRDRDLRGTPLSPRLSLKLSLPALKMAPNGDAPRARSADPNAAVLFADNECRQLIGARRFTRMSRCPHFWSMRAMGTRSARRSDARDGSPGGTGL